MLIETAPPSANDKPTKERKVKKSELKKSITKRTASLISRAFKQLGYEESALYYIEEELYFDEIDSVKAFMEWAQKNHHRASAQMPFIESNYQNLYKNHFLKEYK